MTTQIQPSKALGAGRTNTGTTKTETTTTGGTNTRRINTGRIMVWSAFALVLAVAPLLFKSSLSHTILSQMGIAIIVCLSYNILLGQGGMLSFGHAVYSGMGSFLAIHTLNQISQGSLPLPVSLTPIVGGVASMLVAVLLGWVTTKKSGTT